MARPLRVEYEGAFYHVTSRGNEKREIFTSPEDYEQFKSYLYKSREKFSYKLHAYFLMTNHFHLLIETPEANLKRLMHYTKGSYRGKRAEEENREDNGQIQGLTPYSLTYSLTHLLCAGNFGGSRRSGSGGETAISCGCQPNIPTRNCS